MKRLLIIGIGSRIMGDDGIGVYIVEELIRERFLKNIAYVVGETDIDYCLSHICVDDYVVIIDAALSGKEPGTVTEFTINDIGLCTSLTLSAHNYNLIEAALKQLHDYNFTILGIEPEIIDYRWGLSDALSEAFPHIVDRVRRCILEISNSYLSSSKLYYNTNHGNYKP